MFRVYSLVACLALFSLTSCKKEGSEGGIFSSGNKVVRIGVTAEVGAAPIIAAMQLGLFEKQNIELSLTSHASSAEIISQLAAGQLDLGMTTPAEALLQDNALVVPHILARNVGSVDVSEETWKQLQPHLLFDASGEPLQPITADAIGQISQAINHKGDPMAFQIVSPYHTSTYALSYWLAAAGITPRLEGSSVQAAHPHLAGAQVDLSNADSLFGSAGVRSDQTVISSYDIVRDLPSSVLAGTSAWAGSNRETLVNVVSALVEAGQWLDASTENRRQAAAKVAEFVPTFARDATANVTFGANASAAPDKNHALWLLTQMMRWGQLPSSLKDADLQNMAETTFRADLFEEAVAKLESPYPGLSARLDEQALTHVIDGNVFRPQRPSAYARSFEIGLH